MEMNDDQLTTRGILQAAHVLRLQTDNALLREALKISCVPRWTVYPEQCWSDQEIDELLSARKVPDHIQ